MLELALTRHAMTVDVEDDWGFDLMLSVRVFPRHLRVIHLVQSPSFCQCVYIYDTNCYCLDSPFLAVLVDPFFGIAQSLLTVSFVILGADRSPLS